MNAFRHLLSSGRVTRHALLLLVFSVLVSRGLLPGAVMIDPDQTVGSAFVMCSGHGPMFEHNMHDMHGMQMSGMSGMSMAGMDMSMPGMDMSPDASPMNHHDHDNASKSGDMCAFSASLVTALACAACLLFLFLPFSTRRTWAPPRVAIAMRLLTHVRPPPRAPPAFS